MGWERVRTEKKDLRRSERVPRISPRVAKNSRSGSNKTRQVTKVRYKAADDIINDFVE